ncbi:MAG: transporter related protein, partial [Bryobacterales bacterium]|nr:transporter related protein [Bryobacterales bacterium]
MSLIRVDNVHVAYPVHRGPVKKVLCGVTLEIRAGEFISVVGQTGCGKSTLLRLILGAESPTSGRVLIAGEEKNHPDRDRGYVPQ